MGADLSIEEIFVSLFCRERFESSEHISYFLQNFAPASVQRAVQDEHDRALLKSAALELQQNKAERHLSPQNSNALGFSRLYEGEEKGESAYSFGLNPSFSSLPYCGISPWSHHQWPLTGSSSTGSLSPDPFVAAAEAAAAAATASSAAAGTATLQRPYLQKDKWGESESSYHSEGEALAAAAGLHDSTGLEGISTTRAGTRVLGDTTVYGQWVSALDLPAEGLMTEPGEESSLGIFRPQQCSERSCELCPLKDEPCCRYRYKELNHNEVVAAAAAAQQASWQYGREHRSHAKRNRLATLTIGSMYDFNDLCLAVRYALEEDRVRFIMSAAFRNLQQRIQVFPLDIDVSARSRLTHSFETAVYTKLCITALAERLPKLRFIVKEISACADTAGLLHEIGSPPFGHFGEHVIRAWIDKICKREIAAAKEGNARLNSAQIADLRAFNGHAQGLRLMHSVYRFNMTFGQISAAMRYPYTYAQWRERGYDDATALRRTGVFLSEEELLLRIQRTNLGSKRHPLSCIIEQCDDLAYTLADLEDAHDRRVLDDKDIFELIEKLLEFLQNNACQSTCKECVSACTCAQGDDVPDPKCGQGYCCRQHPSDDLHPERYADALKSTPLTGAGTGTHSASAEGSGGDDRERPGWVRHNQRLREEEHLRRAAHEAAIAAAVAKARDEQASSSDIEAAARKASWDFEQKLKGKLQARSLRIVAGGTNADMECTESQTGNSSHFIPFVPCSRSEGINPVMAAGTGLASTFALPLGPELGRTSGISATTVRTMGSSFAAGFAAPSSGYNLSSILAESKEQSSQATRDAPADAAVSSGSAAGSGATSSTLQGQKGFTGGLGQGVKSLSSGDNQSFVRPQSEQLCEVLRQAIYLAYCHYKHDDFGVLSMVHENTPVSLHTMMEALGADPLFRLLRDCLSSYYIADIVEAIALDEEAFFGEGELSIHHYGNNAHKAIEFLRRYVQAHVYTHEQVESLELRGAAVLRGILESYEGCLALSAEDFQRCLRDGARRYLSSSVIVDPLCARLLHRIPSRCIEAYFRLCEQHPRAEMYARLRLFLDHVSGMTDSFAAHEFALLTGKGEWQRSI